MHETVMQNGTEQLRAAGVSGHAGVPHIASQFTAEHVKELFAALEEPFDPTGIKWRVTNTTQVGGRSGPRFRGQMLAYADPRAYTDRLNDLFTPSGWTRDYTVQLVQNFERRERGSAERTITAKIVVTCKVTVYGFGAHTGLGEEWAEQRQRGDSSRSTGVQTNVLVVLRVGTLSVKNYSLPRYRNLTESYPARKLTES
jgi:hypothetical protein